MELFRHAAFATVVGSLVLTAGHVSADGVPFSKRGALLLADQGEPPFDGIFVFDDLDGDGLALDPSEGHVWFDRTNAEGLLGKTSNFLALLATIDGTVYAADGDSRAVYRLRDLNADGDALDEDESNIFFDASNAAGFPVGVPGGLYSDHEGTIYLTLAGSVANNEPDAVLRLRDLNGDGDANDADEAIVWADLQAFDNGDSVPFELVFRGVGYAYYIEFGGAPDTIRVLDDLNDNGVIEANERSVYLADGAFGVDFGFAIANDAEVLVNGNSGSTQGVWRLIDRNSSGTIDSADEVEFLWSEDQNADGITIGTSFDMERGARQRLYLLDSGSDDRIIVLTDFNNDDDYLDAGETRVFAQGVVHNFDRPRAMAFLPEPAAIAELTDFEVTAGSLLSGGIEELGQSDDTYLHTRSTFGFTVVEPNLMVSEFGFTGVEEWTNLEFIVEHRINHPVGEFTFSLNDWSLDSFRVVATGSVHPFDFVYTVAAADGNLWVRPDDQRIELRIKHVVVAVFSAIGFDSYFDQIEVRTFDLN